MSRRSSDSTRRKEPSIEAFGELAQTSRRSGALHVEKPFTDDLLFVCGRSSSSRNRNEIYHRAAPRVCDDFRGFFPVDCRHRSSSRSANARCECAPLFSCLISRYWLCHRSPNIRGFDGSQIARCVVRVHRLRRKTRTAMNKGLPCQHLARFVRI